jgi:iron complex outermembrane receptor protein
MLLFQEIPKVATASRHAVSMLDAPATASIITRDDIEHMGFLNVPELLVYVTGVNFYKAGGSPVVSIRGVTGMPPNNILVLVDGRPIYSPTRNTNQCAMIPETPADIEKIEIVRGPGSVLYGSHAFAGVINIITRKPEDIDGVIFSAGAGTFSAGKYSITGGRRFGPVACKLLGAWDQRSSESDHANQVRGIMKFAGNITYDFAVNDTASLSFGLVNGNIQVPQLPPIKPFDQDGLDSFLRGMVNFDDLKFDLWWRHHDSSAEYVEYIKSLEWKYDNINFLVSNVFNWKSHEVVYGGEFRFSDVGATSYNGWHSQYIGSLFFEDRWELLDDLNLFVGLRYDHHSEAGGAAAPRVSLVRNLSDNQSVRLVFARAFKFPSYYENYGYTDTGFLVQTGNRDLEPEQLTSFEIAWQMVKPSGLSITAAAFYNHYKNKIDMNYRLDAEQVYIETENMYNFDQYGFELEAGYRFPFGLMIRGNYSYVWNNIPETMINGPAPENQLNGEVRYEHDTGLWLDFRIHWQDRSVYSIGDPPWNDIFRALGSSYSDTGSIMTSNPVNVDYGWQYIDSYASGDISVGYSPYESPWTFSLGIHNVFHNRYEMSQYRNVADTTVSGRITYVFR